MTRLLTPKRPLQFRYFEYEADVRSMAIHLESGVKEKRRNKKEKKGRERLGGHKRASAIPSPLGPSNPRRRHFISDNNVASTLFYLTRGRLCCFYGIYSDHTVRMADSENPAVPEVGNEKAAAAPAPSKHATEQSRCGCKNVCSAVAKSDYTIRRIDK